MRSPYRMLHFAGCTLDLARMLLIRGGKEVALRPKSFDVLRYLAESPGHVISKDELIRNVWAGVAVTDGSLVQCIKEIREAIGDDEHRVVRTVQRRGYMFAASVMEGDTRRLSPDLASPITYAKSGDIHIAYQVYGQGSFDLIHIPGFISHLEAYWEAPSMARWLNRLGGLARVITFDKRGSGLSDRVSPLPTMDERIDDVRAVMDAVGVDRAVVMGASDGGSLACLFAATHPERCHALVLYGAFAQFKSWFPTEESLQHFFSYADTAWGTGASLPNFAPSMAGDEAFQAWWGKFERLGANPSAAMEIMRMNSQIDVTDILPSIHVPTLVIHRTDDVTVDVEAGRLLAARIPHTRYIEMAGVDHLPWVGINPDEIVDSIGDFLRNLETTPVLDRSLAAILVARFTGPSGDNGSADQNDRDSPPAHDAVVQRELARFRGRTVKEMGNGFLATFDGPARAIHGAFAVKTALKQFGIDAEMGIHVGEIELGREEVRGMAVDIAVRVARYAATGDIVVSRTVKDLVAGSGVEFESLGTFSLDEVPDTWQLYRVFRNAI